MSNEEGEMGSDFQGLWHIDAQADGTSALFFIFSGYHFWALKSLKNGSRPGGGSSVVSWGHLSLSQRPGRVIVRGTHLLRIALALEIPPPASSLGLLEKRLCFSPP